MKKQLIILGVAVLLICVGLSGCFESDNESSNVLDKFVGKWTSASLLYEKTITFFSDGTGFNNSGSIEWEIKDEQLVIYWHDGNHTAIYDYEFLKDEKYGDILILSDVDTGHIVHDYKKI